MTELLLPIAGRSRLRSECRRLARQNRRPLIWLVVLHVVAAGIAVVPPRLLGELVASVQAGTTTSHVDHVVLVLIPVVLAAALAMRWARLSAYTFAERVLAELREGSIGRLLQLPLGIVE